MKVTKKKTHYEVDLNVEKHTLMALGLVLFTLIINVYYFNANTGVWWDEAEYLSFVNHVVDGSPYSLWEGRAILYPLLLSVFGFINNSEFFLRIVLVFISCVTVFFTFQVLNILFKEKIAFLATLMFLCNGLFDFFSIRFLTGIPSLMFIMLGLYFFLKKGNKNKLLSGLFIGCAVAIRFTSVFIIPGMIIYDLLSKTKIKGYAWVPAVLIGFIPSIIFDVVRGELPWTTLLTFFTQSTAERSWGHNLGDWTYYLYNSPGVITLNTPYLLLVWILLFITGLFIFLASFKGSKKTKVLLVITFLILHFSSYSFLTPLKEERYMIPILPFIYSILIIGLLSMSTTISKFFSKKLKVKNLEHFLVLVFTVLVVLNSLSMGKSMINYSRTGFEELRYAGEAIKENTDADEVIITNAGPHIAYHSERSVTGFPSSMTGLYDLLNNNSNMNIMVFSFYETAPNYLEEFYNNSDFTILEEYVRSNSSIVITLGYLRE